VIIQLNPEIWVNTPLGEGLAIMVIDYGINHNTCWVVSLKKDGQVKHFDSNDIRLIKNFTYNFNTKKGAKK